MALRRGLASTGSLLLLASLLVGQFLATTHEFTARHATCSRHGEVMDVEARGSFLRAGAAPTHTSTQLSTLNQESSQTQHQHCLFVSSRGSQKNFRIVGPADYSRSAAAHWMSATSADALHPSRALYLTAPKHSPPAA
ncbi:MAG: hypothetical protein L0099_14440 [Acidobacteria bacterium]|nr:hypothetical protein [Acidobacteriota bacterium]